MIYTVPFTPIGSLRAPIPALLPISVTLFHTHSRGCRTNILYTVPFTPIGSLRTPIPALLPISVPLFHTRSRGYRTNILYTASLTRIDSLRDQVPALLPVSAPFFPFSCWVTDQSFYTVLLTPNGSLRTPTAVFVYLNNNLTHGRLTLLQKANTDRLDYTGSDSRRQDLLSPQISDTLTEACLETWWRIRLSFDSLSVAFMSGV
jgi:hypothetical protein